MKRGTCILLMEAMAEWVILWPTKLMLLLAWLVFALLYTIVPVPLYLIAAALGAGKPLRYICQEWATVLAKLFRGLMRFEQIID